MANKKEKDKEIEVGLDLTGVETETKIEDNKYLEIDSLKKQLEESQNKYLLLYADFDNYKRRVVKEKEELVTNTKVKTLTSILDMDNDLTYAIKSVKSDEAKSGLELISNKLESYLKSQGIEPIQTSTYDEDLHEVIQVMEIGEKKIIDVVSKGYSLNGKPFRYPKIILGK
jgi:molecular chaperone GrpE